MAHNHANHTNHANQNIYDDFANAYQTALKTTDTPNLALCFERFCPFDGKANKGAYINLKDDAAKFKWLEQFNGKLLGCKYQIEAEHTRRQRLCDAIHGRLFMLKLDWRFITGSGNPHPIKNGLTWHPTLGIPYLPASGFKGLLRNFLTHWQGDAATLQQALFGDTEAAGQLQFFDVLPTGPVKLLVDVMTPHYANWYVAGGNPETALDAQNIPAPWHNPVPIPFLVVDTPLTLCAMVAPARGEPTQLVWDQLETLLKEAFSVAGAGAKTASGYGRMTLSGKDEAKKGGISAQGLARLKESRWHKGN